MKKRIATFVLMDIFWAITVVLTVINLILLIDGGKQLQLQQTTDPSLSQGLGVAVVSIILLPGLMISCGTGIATLSFAIPTLRSDIRIFRILAKVALIFSAVIIVFGAVHLIGATIDWQSVLLWYA